MSHWRDLLDFPRYVDELHEIDLRLLRLQEALDVSDDPLGTLDDIDIVAGEGFLKLQLYLIERKGELDAKIAYDCGPRHNTFFFADVINTAANFRKHRSEWPEDRTKWKKGQHRTVEVFRDAGVVENDFWLVHLLARLTEPAAPQFSVLIPRVIEWRDALDQLPEREQGRNDATRRTHPSAS